MEFECPICGNKDSKKIGYLNGVPYCRNCISFKGDEVDSTEHYPKRAYYKLNYDLSEDQKRISKNLIDNYKRGINTLVHAVCGSGKTEIVLEVIRYVIECGERVGFAVPRRDVAIELFDRFDEIFKRNKVTLVYGGHTDNLDGDLICLTTHQLFRYQNYFDLLILDEVDAFPFKGNELLNTFFNRSLRGKCILLSATPDNELIKQFSFGKNNIQQLYSRFHSHPLPVPKLVIKNQVLIYPTLLHIMNKELKRGKQVFIFCPTVEICNRLFKLLNIVFKNGNYVNSKRKDRENIIKDFKNKKYQYLVTTAVLERGVTVKGLQVIVFKANHQIYDSYSLVQIAGRVGRKKDEPEGNVYFLATKNNIEITSAIEEIKYANKSL